MLLVMETPASVTTVREDLDWLVNAATFGNGGQAPFVERVTQVLEDPDRTMAIITLLARRLITLADFAVAAGAFPNLDAVHARLAERIPASAQQISSQRH